MAKAPIHETDTPPRDYAQVPPRDLYPTSDIRFVITEVAKLTTQVERLILDVGSLDDKLDGVRHNISFVKGALWVLGGVVAALALLATWYFSGRLSITLTPGA